MVAPIAIEDVAISEMQYRSQRFFILNWLNRGAAVMIHNTVAKLSWNPALNNASGEKTRIMSAAAINEFTTEAFLPKMKVEKENTIITVARTTDGGSPVSKSYMMMIATDSMNLNFFSL